MAGVMCYIQLSLLGCAGYVVIADTLTQPITGAMLFPNLTEEQDAWFMPLNFAEPIWMLRQCKEMRKDVEQTPEPQAIAAEEPKRVEVEKIQPKIEEIQPKIEEIQPKIEEITMCVSETGQLSLF